MMRKIEWSVADSIHTSAVAPPMIGTVTFELLSLVIADGHTFERTKQAFDLVNGELADCYVAVPAIGAAQYRITTPSGKVYIVPLSAGSEPLDLSVVLASNSSAIPADAIVQLLGGYATRAWVDEQLGNGVDLSNYATLLDLVTETTNRTNGDATLTTTLNSHQTTIGGASLGHVKNGGNVVIEPDGTMTAPDPDLSGYATTSAMQTADAGLQTQITANTNALATKADLVGGKVPTAQLPAIVIGETFTVANQAAMLALVAQNGDVAIRSDLGNRKFLLTGDPSVLSNWIEIGAADAVSSVNGQTGAVVLSAANVGAATASHTHSHTALTDIGTNTHTQIDTHIANLNNPHAVTAAQVGALTQTQGDARYVQRPTWLDLTPYLTAGWVVQGNGFLVPQYAVLADRVIFRGAVARVSGTSSVVATMPVGARASARQLIGAWSQTGATELNILADGTINLWTGGYQPIDLSNTWYWL